MRQSEAMDMVKLTRKDFYDQVWSTPLSHLAAKYGLSDVALAKTCRKWAIPHPGRGYWARIAAGEQPTRTPLPKTKTQDDAPVIYLRLVEKPDPVAPNEPAPDVAVPETLEEAPAEIRRLASALRKARTDEYGRLVVPATADAVLCVTISAHRRALLLLSALTSSLRERGHATDFRENRQESKTTFQLACVAKEETIEIYLEERLDRKEGDSGLGQKPTLLGRTPKTNHEYVASGRLLIGLRSGDRSRRTWTDAAGRRLEQMLGRVVQGVEAEADSQKLRRREEARQREEAANRLKQYEEEQRQIQQQRRREKHTVLLTEDLRNMTRAWRDAAEMQDFLRAIEQSVPATSRGPDFEAWLCWAWNRTRELDPLSNPLTIPKVLEPEAEEPPRNTSFRGYQTS